MEAVVAGASRRDVAERQRLSSSAVVLWMQRWAATGSIEAKPIGGSISPREHHADFQLDLFALQPALTLDEIVAAMAKAGIAGSRTADWRFYERREATFKKTLYASAQSRPDVARAPTPVPSAASAGFHRVGVS